MIKAFPEMEIERSEVYVFAWIEHEPTHFDLKWWDEEYKEPNHIVDAGKMMGSTNKNDLGVDLISRADVLKLMQDNWHTHNGDWAMQESMDDIRALPSVTSQEPRRGHWILRNSFLEPKCSECNYECERYNFCPNCGAKMVEPQESER